jgi:hypothetical protein
MEPGPIKIHLLTPARIEPSYIFDNLEHRRLVSIPVYTQFSDSWKQNRRTSTLCLRSVMERGQYFLDGEENEWVESKRQKLPCNNGWHFIGISL